MIRVIGDGEERHRLEDASGAQIGWIFGRALGLRGLRSPEEAMRAVAATWPTLDAALRRHYFGRPPLKPALDRLRLVHDGAYEWVSDGLVPLARLHRPRADQGAGDFAIEFVLPSYATGGVVIAVAQVVGSAFGAHLARASGAARHEHVAAGNAPAAV